MIYLFINHKNVEKMKRVIFLFAFLMFTLGAWAQNNNQFTLSPGVTYYHYEGQSDDVIGARYDTVTVEILTNKATPLNCNARVEVTRAGTTDDYEYRLQGKVFESESWTSLVDESGETGDLTINHPVVIVDTSQDGSADVFYRYFRVLVASDGTMASSDSLTIDDVYFKLYER